MKYEKTLVAGRVITGLSVLYLAANALVAAGGNVESDVVNQRLHNEKSPVSQKFSDSVSEDLHDSEHQEGKYAIEAIVAAGLYAGVRLIQKRDQNTDNS